VAFLAAQNGSGLTGKVLDVANFGRDWGVD
jgi:hypothetical protein